MKCPICKVQCACEDKVKSGKNYWQNIPEIEPTVVNDKGPIGEFRETHPAFGCISISRVQGGKGHFFGSGIEHNNFIELTIMEAERNRSKYSEHVFSKSPLIQIQMTMTQWAEFITTMNYGSGTPCTLHAMKTEAGFLPFPTFKLSGRKKEINDDLKRKVHELGKKIVTDQDRVNELLDKKGSLKVSEREELRSMMTMMNQDLESNLPFLGRCMQESFDNIVAEAKGEIEAHLQHAVNVLGERGLAQQLTNDSLKLIDTVEVPEKKKLKRISK